MDVAIGKWCSIYQRKGGKKTKHGEKGLAVRFLLDMRHLSLCVVLPDNLKTVMRFERSLIPSYNISRPIREPGLHFHIPSIGPTLPSRPAISSTPNLKVPSIVSPSGERTSTRNTTYHNRWRR